MWGIFIPVLQNHVGDEPKGSEKYKFWFNDSITSGFDYGVYATVGMILADCLWNVGKMMMVLCASNNNASIIPGQDDADRDVINRPSGSLSTANRPSKSVGMSSSSNKGKGR
eukprot:CAMPEP_0114331784 /NCGR_PEP_ID=MMETSP0101-20121206/2648_1 /TAXON_ID=38822 ORGANISM="Pteridomonas danica, Strain PT" /NCGR_SAMPLE_ID=MMETSP0101 /ASSEMBLY_ACC=CAM_ASM_000211 /LENGTH=111 /DNA_ID=CAMNT_0001462243 /DNA_START=393 /DNA_END=728 /DNA_ORIENTATION=-